jgi:hypothetical protein
LQHQDLRSENGQAYGDTIDHLDFAYLEKVAKLNTAALAAIASAPPPPEPTVEGAVSTDTTVKWKTVPGVTRYKIWWRRTDSSNWQNWLPAADRSPTMSVGESGTAGTHKLAGTDHTAVLEHIRVDDWVFGVSSVGNDGWESPVASAVPGGAFKPWVKRMEEKK